MGPLASHGRTARAAATTTYYLAAMSSHRGDHQARMPMPSQSNLAPHDVQ